MQPIWCLSSSNLFAALFRASKLKFSSCAPTNRLVYWPPIVRAAQKLNVLTVLGLIQMSVKREHNLSVDIDRQCDLLLELLRCVFITVRNEL